MCTLRYSISCLILILKIMLYQISSRTVFIISILLASLLGSCKKQATGAPGEQGPPGKDGNVTIKNIPSFIHPSSAWTKDQNGWKSIITVPEINRDVVDKGMVRVYIQIGSSWWDLPYSSGGISTESGVDVGIVVLKNNDINGAITPQPVTQNYRIVIVTPL